jgi:uncharacterized protein (DUF2461 family)
MVLYRTQFLEKVNYMSQLFTQNTYKFFKNLEENNTKEWFHEHKPDFEKYVKTPIVELTIIKNQ